MAKSQLDVQTIFNRAIELDEGEARLEFLEEACAGDSAVRDRVDALLRAHGEAGNFFAGASQSAASTLSQEGSGLIGSQVGLYKLREQIGEGGMGVVYLAEQKQPVARRVALKIIKPGMDAKQVMARFEAERQALAMMDHPNVAKFLEAGTTETGCPYFVMELVNGTDIATYCDRNDLTIRQRLELFLPVCCAVQHAHQKGILHRDLKPSNILVARFDDRAVPKIIDFGVAKAINQQLTERTLFTAFGQIVGTWQYMSPEQAVMNQLDIDTRSDIYSLGAVLYELLTGATPIDGERLRAAGFEETMRLIREEEPKKPSTRISGSGKRMASTAGDRHADRAGLSKLLRGDLDWIVMKSLEKDRSRRYETASAMREDIARFLRKEPVSAGPPSGLYVLKKYVSRNKGRVYAGSIVFVAVMLGLLATGVAGYLAYTKSTEMATINGELTDTVSALRQSQTEQLTNLAFHAWTDGNYRQFQQYVDQLNRDATTMDNESIERRILHAFHGAYRDVPHIDTENSVVSLDFSTDGSLLAVGCIGKDTLVFHTSAMTPVRSFPGSQATHVDFSPDGTMVAISSANLGPSNRVELFKIGNDGTFTLHWQREGLATAQFAPDSNTLACAFVGGIRIVEAESGEQIFDLPSSEGVEAETGFSFSPDGRFLASFGRAGVAIANLQTRQHMTSPIMDDPNAQGWTFAEFSLDGSLLVVGSEEGLSVYHAAPSGVFSKHTDLELAATCCCFSPDGMFLAVGSAAHNVTIWNTSSFRQVGRLLYGDYVNTVAFTPDGQKLAVGGRTRKVQIWDDRYWIPHDVIAAQPTPFPALTVTPTGRVVVVEQISDDGEDTYLLKTWDPETHDEQIVRTETSEIQSVACSPDGRHLAYGTADGDLAILDLGSKRSVHHVAKLHSGNVRSLAYSPDGRWLISGGRSPYLQRINLKSFSIDEIVGHKGIVYALAFNQDGILASGGVGISNDDGDTIFWDLSGDTPKELNRIKHPRWVRGISFSPTSPDNVVISDDFSSGVIKSYDWRSGKVLQSFRGHSSKTVSLAYSHDGSRLITGSDDRTLRFWSAETGALLGSLGIGDRSRKIAVFADGRFASASWEGHVRVFPPNYTAMSSNSERSTTPMSPANTGAP